MARTISKLSLPALAFLAAAAPVRQSQAATDGPDLGGYRYVDQNDGAVFNYVDISLTGTLLVNADDETATFTLGQTFDIYGVTHSELRVSTNGWLSDGDSTSSDLSPNCPLPMAPGTGEGTFRVPVLHDDLVSSVRYQYFDGAQATALGYAGTTNGISVIQWVGNHFGGGAIDAETILFHDTGEILTMVNADAETGAASTLGIELVDGVTGLNYGCDTNGYISPGETAVLFTPGTPPTSDCCTAAPSADVGGCTLTSCQVAVCADNAACCDDDWDSACATSAATLCSDVCGPVSINELRIDQTGSDTDEYFELSANAGTELYALTYLVLGDGSGGSGTVEAAIDLDGESVGADGLFVVAEASFSLGGQDIVAPLSFENTDTVTHMLVRSFSGSVGQDLDTDDDGIFDTTPWSEVLDIVAVVDSGSTELPYGPPNVCTDGPFCQEVDDGGSAAQHIFRCEDASGTWNVGTSSVGALPSTDTPGEPNNCLCGDGIIVADEECDGDGGGAGGETDTCNVDCTDAECGDGVINTTAGETCDGDGAGAGGETALCNIDCSASACGDGIINNTAGETCDGDGMGMGGETDMCDDDCTAVDCGDGVINIAAGEMCDGDGMGAGGETDVCDDDCTTVVCGDGVVNVTAGEACDDMGESDACNDDCTLLECGDGVVNATAGEDCDDEGESATCNDDCTDAECGDGVVNAAASETCDDEGESVTCNDDCTDAECGDSVLNTTAGETCDDGNTDDGDGCAADCTEEVAGTDTGGDTDTGDGTGDDTGDDTGGDDTGGDDTAGETAADDTDGDDGNASVGATVTAGMTAGTGNDSGDGTDGDTETGGAAPTDDGCSCSSDPSDAPWGLFALFGVGAIRRRRRS